METNKLQVNLFDNLKYAHINNLFKSILKVPEHHSKILELYKLCIHD